MSEEEARERLRAEFDVSRETLTRMDEFVKLLQSTARAQNLIADSTRERVWERHILDSAQLLKFSSSTDPWLDIGSGAGFPGLVIAAVDRRRMTLVEPRRLRAEFLARAIDVLQLGSVVRLIRSRIESVPTSAFATISARAFARLDQIFTVAERFAAPRTRWLLPKGRSARAELEMASQKWQGDFRIATSMTDPNSAIIIAEQVRAKR